MEQRKILILTSKTGGGHVSLAEALRDRLASSYAIEILDPQAPFFHWHYRIVSRYALWLWSAEFQLMDTPPRALFAHHIFTRLVSHALNAALQRIQPALIITTYPFLTYEVMQVLQKRACGVPFVMLFTDPQNLHASWLTERRASATLAPTGETYQQALSAGFVPERLYAVGWPVRSQFSQVYDTQRAVLLTKLGLDPQCFTIFLQGGGEGAAQFGATVERVLGLDPPVQIILAAGSNQALLARFSRVKRLYALPFTKEIASFMALADVVMGKAGPNMLFEAVTLGKPFIATAYIPGQEEANLDFIRRHQLGWVALDAAEQCQLLTRLTRKSDELAAMTESVEAYRELNAQAASTIVPIIEQLLLP